MLAPDLIGFGESARPDANLTAADYARSLAEFIRGTCDEPVIIVASGLGGGLSVLLASQHPEVVKQLLLWMPTGLTELGMREVSIGRRIASMAPMVHRFMYRNYESSRAAVRGWLVVHGFADASRITEETRRCLYNLRPAIRGGTRDPEPVRRTPERGSGGASADVFAAGDTIMAGAVRGSAGRTACAIARAGAGQSSGAGARLSQLAAVEEPSEIASLLADELDTGAESGEDSGIPPRAGCNCCCQHGDDRVREQIAIKGL